MSSNEEAIKLNLFAIVYPEAPDNFEETESGKLILNSSELLLPGDISFSLNQLKTARYVKIEDKHVIIVTTTADNEIYFTISGATKPKSISYAEVIADSIPNSAPAITQTDDAAAPATVIIPPNFNTNALANTLAESSDNKLKITNSQEKHIIPPKSARQYEKKKMNGCLLAIIIAVAIVVGLVIIVTFMGILIAIVTPRDASTPTTDPAAPVAAPTPAAPAPAPTPTTVAPTPVPAPATNDWNDSAQDMPEPFILGGPHFSLDEPWRISQFNEALVGKKCGFDDVKSADQIDTYQGKTIKTDVGKIYYLEVRSELDDYSHRAFIGLRRFVNDKKIVTFYTLQTKDSLEIMLDSGGTMAHDDSNNSLNGIYDATYGNKNFKIIEFNENEWTEWTCHDEEFVDEETGIIDIKKQNKCKATSVWMSQFKLAFAIDENGKVMASGVVSKGFAKCKDLDTCDKQVSKQIQSIKDGKSFNLGNMVCVPNISANTKGDPPITCHQK